MEISIKKKIEKCIIHSVGNCALCNRGIHDLEAKDFKIKIGGKNMEVTKATFDTFSGGYFLEWDED